MGAGEMYGARAVGGAAAHSLRGMPTSWLKGICPLRAGAGIALCLPTLCRAKRGAAPDLYGHA
jgi:hypothetical protein